MAKDQGNSTSRVGTLAQKVRARRHAHGVGPIARLLDAMASPSLGMGLLIAVAFASICSITAIFTRDQPLVAVGRVMDETRLVRVEITTRDEALTQQRREAARQATPRVYVADAPAIEKIQNELDNLPRTLAAAETIDAVDATIREQFRLTPEMLLAVKTDVVEGQASPAWTARVRSLISMLHRRPLLDAQTWQRGVIEGTATSIKLVVDGKTLPPVHRAEAVNIDDAEALEAAAKVLARDAGFMMSQRQLVVNRLTTSPRPTFAFDAAQFAKDQNAAAESVRDAVTVNPVAQVIFRRGDVLSESQAALYRREMAAFEEQVSPAVRWAKWIGVAGACFAVTLGLAGNTLLFCPRVRRNAPRMFGVAAILAGAFVLACVSGVLVPEWSAMSAVAPTLMVTMLITIGYDRRAALAYGLLHGLLVCIALRESIGTYGVITAGVAAIVWSLKEIRDRNSLVRASVATALSVALATAIFSVIERMISVPQVIREMGIDAALAGGGAVGVGAAALFLLPMIERAFNATTGMTLIELRDPKQPLLRELQQRAPGTYNHSLNVASIGEAAAEAIGADGLLTYVGALYHDIGKMNKPEYFVENQAGGPNKHDRLSPAMSLLIVVGHVKDGMELAREFRLPARLQHFIEAHHGTTLVEYFFHRARKQALDTAPKDKSGQAIEDDTYLPDEHEYRYPGPKPKSREVAILMVADAVESATRAMAEPTPAKIDQLVRGIAHKRLLDGQFDDCELTLRELNLIVESVIRTVTSMHHARIAYPEEAPTRVADAPTSVSATSGPTTQPG